MPVLSELLKRFGCFKKNVDEASSNSRRRTRPIKSSQALLLCKFFATIEEIYLLSDCLDNSTDSVTPSNLAAKAEPPLSSGLNSIQLKSFCVEGDEKDDLHGNAVSTNFPSHNALARPNTPTESKSHISVSSDSNNSSLSTLSSISFEEASSHVQIQADWGLLVAPRPKISPPSPPSQQITPVELLKRNDTTCAVLSKDDTSFSFDDYCAANLTF